MLNEEICKKRDELNNSIQNGNDYEVVYNLSVELDNLIAKYYINEEKYTQNNQNLYIFS